MNIKPVEPISRIPEQKKNSQLSLPIELFAEWIQSVLLWALSIIALSESLSLQYSAHAMRTACSEMSEWLSFVWTVRSRARFLSLVLFTRLDLRKRFIGVIVRCIQTLCLGPYWSRHRSSIHFIHSFSAQHSNGSVVSVNHFRIRCEFAKQRRRPRLQYIWVRYMNWSGNG